MADHGLRASADDGIAAAAACAALLSLGCVAGVAVALEYLAYQSLPADLVGLAVLFNEVRGEGRCGVSRGKVIRVITREQLADAACEGPCDAESDAESDADCDARGTADCDADDCTDDRADGIARLGTAFAASRSIATRAVVHTGSPRASIPL